MTKKIHFSSLKNADGAPTTVGCPGLDIDRISRNDPALGLALAQSPSKQPLIYAGMAQFTSGALNEKTDISIGGENGLDSDFLILSTGFQVRRNAAFTGSILKGQADDFNARNSGVNVNVFVQGKCPNIQVTSMAMPIELVFGNSDDEDNGMGFPYAYVAPKCGQIKVEVTNTRPFATADGPVEVWVAIRGIALGCALCSIDLPFANEELARLGISSRRVIVDG